MPIDEPRWWYGPEWPAVASLLQSAAALYGRIAVARYRRAPPYRSRLPVICVGNLVAGGTGKTPLSLHIAHCLREHGYRPAFLTRGYGGRVIGPHRVDHLLDAARDVGDEPLLLAQAATTIVSHDRAAGARMIEETSATHIIMDDGLLNPGIAKDLSLAVVDGARWIGNGRVIPAGPLRAPLAFQSELVDALVITGAGEARSTLPDALRRTFACPVIHARRRIDGPPEDLGERPWIAFAGIGRPEGFFEMLQDNGARLAAHVAFRDHHAFSQADAQRLLSMARTHAAGLITTEKDWVRLPADGGYLGDLKQSARILKMRLEFSAGDAARLLDLLAALAR